MPRLFEKYKAANFQHFQFSFNLHSNNPSLDDRSASALNRCDTMGHFVGLRPMKKLKVDGTWAHGTCHSLPCVIGRGSSVSWKKSRAKKSSCAPSSATCQLCDIGRVTSLLWTSVASTEKQSLWEGFHRVLKDSEITHTFISSKSTCRKRECDCPWLGRSPGSCVSSHLWLPSLSPLSLSFTASCTCFRLNTQSLSFSLCNGGFSETGVLWLFIFAFPHLATRGVLGMFIKLKTLCNRCPAWDRSFTSVSHLPSWTRYSEGSN